MSSFPDANVWLALIWNRHQHFESAASWWLASDGPVIYTRFTQITVLRLLTTSAIMGPDVCTMQRAWAVWDTAVSDDRMAWLPEPDGIETALREHSRLRTASPKVWADAYLVAFAKTADLTLVTFDRALGRKAARSVVLE